MKHSTPIIIFLACLFAAVSAPAESTVTDTDPPVSEKPPWMPTCFWLMRWG